MKLVRMISFSSLSTLFLTLATSAFAQIATDSAGKGGTSGALPNAGTTSLTYLLFLAGILLFVFGTLKLIVSFRQ